MNELTAKPYEPPEIKVLGAVSDLTQGGLHPGGHTAYPVTPCPTTTTTTPGGPMPHGLS